MPNPARISATIDVLLEAAAGPARVGDLMVGGVSRGRLRSALASGQLMALRRGVVIPRVRWSQASADERSRWAAEAALLAFPGSFASHATAAWLQGLPDYRLGGGDIDGVPMTHITRIGSARTEGWLRVHGCDTPPHHVCDIRGISSTDLVRTSIELAADRSLATAVVFLDAGFRRAALNEHGERSLRDAVLQVGVRSALGRRWDAGIGPYARHRWVTRVRAALALADPAAESVLESLSRVAIHDWGIPAPRCGVPLVGDNNATYWVDMYWDEFRLIGEADGDIKYSDAAALLSEKRRQEALEARGFRFVRWGWREVVPDSEVLARRIRHAMATPPPRRREWS